MWCLKTINFMTHVHSYYRPTAEGAMEAELIARDVHLSVGRVSIRLELLLLS